MDGHSCFERDFNVEAFVPINLVEFALIERG